MHNDVIDISGIPLRMKEELKAHLSQVRRRVAAENEVASDKASPGEQTQAMNDCALETRPVAEELTLDNIEAAMRYQPWDREQTDRGDQIREALTHAAKVILRNVPRCPFRSVCLRKIIEARMDANAGISFRGRF